MTEIIGKSVTEAKNFLQEQGKQLRVIEKDGESYVFTCDYWENRINVRVAEGRVSEVAFTG